MGIIRVRHELRVELHGVDADLGGLQAQQEATRAHAPHMGAQEIVGEQFHVTAEPRLPF